MTTSRTAKKVGVTQVAFWKWLSGKSMPRVSNLIVLARVMDCTVEEALKAIQRAQAVFRATGELPYGLIIRKDMLKKEYAKIKA